VYESNVEWFKLLAQTEWIHCHLKPSNILIDKEEHIRLTDIGTPDEFLNEQRIKQLPIKL
jgi:serine/threonine protein kinase